MAEIKKLNLYLSEIQYHKLCLLAEQKGISPEQVANEAVYSCLAIVDPHAVDYDDMSPAQKAAADQRYIDWCLSEGLDPYIDEEEQRSTFYYASEKGSALMQYDPLDPNVEIDEEGYKI